MTDTPRTDAVTEWHTTSEDYCLLGLVPADFARQLERELNEALFHLAGNKAERETLEAELQEIKARIDYLEEELNR